MKYSERKLSQHKNSYFYRTPPVTASGSVENVFLVVSQNSQENIKKEKKETLAQVFSCEFCKIYRNYISCRIAPVAASCMSSHSLTPFPRIHRDL